MRRILWFSALLLLLGSRSAGAIQLRWAGGATDLTVSQNTQAVLVVQADSAEVTLPNSWRLQWAADSLGLHFSSFSQACLVDTAKVDSIAPPSTPADSAANETTAWFCSSGTANAATAYYLADLPARGYGKIKLEALNPTDTTHVIESNEVTFNGGVAGDFSPSILRVIVTHDGSPILITASGTSLALVTSAIVLTPDTTWRIPLTIQTRTDTSITAAGTMPQALQGASLLLSTATGVPSLSRVPDDAVIGPDNVEGAYPYLTNLYDPDQPYVRPKDFAFIYNTVYTPPPLGLGWEGMFHVFYIRHFDTGIFPADNETTFVHAWWREDGINRAWKYDTTAFNRGNAYWDKRHVWAPSIVFRGGQYVMYYTGVDVNDNERIGYATIPAIDTSDTRNSDWHKQATPVLTADGPGWTSKTQPQQCRA